MTPTPPNPSVQPIRQENDKGSHSMPKPFQYTINNSYYKITHTKVCILPMNLQISQISHELVF
ncbi:hypothetical protein Scep_026218 [Stephania cephalantha]|uniref:Uncharacterized protein n=1 Tax=Stephania cephalantha TaxID=152367 RepID=A0AAP0ETL8_9MAGN